MCNNVTELKATGIERFLGLTSSKTYLQDACDARHFSNTRYSHAPISKTFSAVRSC
jgi:hypothetical protein